MVIPDIEFEHVEREFYRHYLINSFFLFSEYDMKTGNIVYARCLEHVLLFNINSKKYVFTSKLLRQQFSRYS